MIVSVLGMAASGVNGRCCWTRLCGWLRSPHICRGGGCCVSSVGRVTLVSVEVTEVDIARIPPTNLRVSRTEFAALWTAAEQRCDEQDRRGGHDWYSAGVAITCEWLAGATVRSFDGRWFPAHAPVTKSTRRAYEELIEAEYLAAEKLDMRRPRPSWLKEQPGWIDGICATLRWAWRRSGPPPIELDERATG